MTSADRNTASDPLRMGFIGCGRVVERFHLPAVQSMPNWVAVAACDPRESRLAWIRSAAPEIDVFATPEQMLSEIRLDAVLVATPPSIHLVLTLAALKAGVHVLLEKPGGVSSAEANQIANAAEISGKRLQVGFNRRFRPANQALRQAIEARGSDASGTARYRLQIPVKEWGAVAGRFLDPGAGGGILYDVVSHQLDLVIWLFGRPVEEMEVGEDSDPSLGPFEVRGRLAGGVTFSSIASYASEYVERLSVSLDGLRVVSHHTGLLRSSWLRADALNSVAQLQDWAARKLVRLGWRADELMLSYIQQLKDFRRSIGDPNYTSSGAAAPDLVQVHALLETLREASILKSKARR